MNIKKRTAALFLAALLAFPSCLFAADTSPDFELAVYADDERIAVYTPNEIIALIGRPGTITIGGDMLVSGLYVTEFMARLGLTGMSSEVAFSDGENETPMKSLNQYASDGDVIALGSTSGIFSIVLYDAEGFAHGSISRIITKPEYNFAVYPEVQGVRNIIPDGFGGAWIASTTGLFYLSSDGSVRRMYEDKLDTQWVYDAALDSEGDLWVTQGYAYALPGDMDKNRGVIHFSRLGEKLEQFTLESTGGKLPNNFVQAIAVDSEDNVWIGHFPGPDGEGLTKYNPSSKEWTSWSDADGLAVPSVNTLLPDDSGGMWICGYPFSGANQAGPFSGGYSYIDKAGKITSWSYSEETHPDLSGFYIGDFWSRHAALDSKGGVYVTRAGGDSLSNFYNPDFGNLPIEHSAGGYVDYISPDKSSKTIYTGRELSVIIDHGIFAQLDPETGRAVSGATPEVRAVDTDARDGIWLGTAGLGVIFKPNIGQAGGIHYSSRSFAWPSRNGQFDNIRVVKTEPDGTVYVGSNGGLAVNRFTGSAKISPAPRTAAPSAHRVTVDGEPVELNAYNIDGSNYFKLRGLALALNATSKSFEVVWNPSKVAVDILPGMHYTIVGGENSVSSGAVGSGTHQLLVAGKKAYPDSYNIGGSNYFKLRDLAPLIGFSFEWDDETQTVLITTAD